ncbi:MAG: hypothetical protein HYT81_12455 [Gemmatimonadetes bacterium]|nr:hypothetical protein [Gemmatimonadota bacterium]
MEWTRETYQLPGDHGWTAKPGHKILVLDRGAVLLEFPAHWSMEPGPPPQINLRDGPTAEDSSCLLAVSCLRLLLPVDFSGLPLSKLLLEAAEGDERDHIATGPVHEETREGLTLAWTELRVVDPGEHRECRSRMCLARGNGAQCLITFDFWPEDEGRFSGVWDEVLSSLKLGVRVDDPTQGPRIE